MKTELRLRNHSVLPGQIVAEIWHDGLFIGEVCGHDVAGVRVISKHLMTVSRQQGGVGVVNVYIDKEK